MELCWQYQSIRKQPTSHWYQLVLEKYIMFWVPLHYFHPAYTSSLSFVKKKNIGREIRLLYRQFCNAYHLDSPKIETWNGGRRYINYVQEKCEIFASWQLIGGVRTVEEVVLPLDNIYQHWEAQRLISQYYTSLDWRGRLELVSITYPWIGEVVLN